MRSVNKVILVGNLTRDPEMRQTGNGQNVVTFGMATNREWVTRDGRKQSSAEFHELVAWAKLADICGKYLKKGKLVYIEGYLKTRSWDSPEGIKKFKTEIVVQDMIMLDKRQNGESAEDYVPDDREIMEEQPYNEPAARTAKRAEPAIIEPHREAKTESNPSAAQPKDDIGAESNNGQVNIDDDLGL